MEDKNFKNGIEEIKKIKMTVNEKQQIFDNILNSPINKDVKIKSPWITFAFISKISEMRLAYYVVIPLLIIVTGGGAVFASETSLPDSILYPVKVNIVEPIRGALTFSTKAKADYESELATKRMVEAETLAVKGKLDISNEEKINTLLEKHNKKLNKVIDKIEEEDKSEQVDEIVINFQAKMNAHAKVLDIITSKEIKKEEKKKKEEFSSTNQLKIEDSNLEKDNLEKRDVERKEIKEKKVNQVSVSARTSADNIGSRIKIKQDEKVEKEENEDFKNAYESFFDSEGSIKDYDNPLKEGLKSKDKKGHKWSKNTD